MPRKPESAKQRSPFNGSERYEDQGFDARRAKDDLTVTNGTQRAAGSAEGAKSLDPCRHSFKHAGAPTFPVARLGKNDGQA